MPWLRSHRSLLAGGKHAWAIVARKLHKQELANCSRANLQACKTAHLEGNTASWLSHLVGPPQAHYPAAIEPLMLTRQQKEFLQVPTCWAKSTAQDNGMRPLDRKSSVVTSTKLAVAEASCSRRLRYLQKPARVRRPPGTSQGARSTLVTPRAR